MAASEVTIRVVESEVLTSGKVVKLAVIRHGVSVVQKFLSAF